MRHTRIITSITSKLRLPAATLEEIVNHRMRRTKYHYPATGIDKELYRNDLDTILTYSLEATVKGNLQIEVYNNNSNTVELLLTPVVSSFLVTCIKEKGSAYQVELSTSLN